MGVDELFVLLRQGTYGQILSPNLPTLINNLLFLDFKSKPETKSSKWPLVNAVRTTTLRVKRASIARSTWNCTPATPTSQCPCTLTVTTWPSPALPSTSRRRRTRSASHAGGAAAGEV